MGGVGPESMEKLSGGNVGMAMAKNICPGHHLFPWLAPRPHLQAVNPVPIINDCHVPRRFGFTGDFVGFQCGECKISKGTHWWTC